MIYEVIATVKITGNTSSAKDLKARVQNMEI